MFSDCCTLPYVELFVCYVTTTIHCINRLRRSGLLCKSLLLHHLLLSGFHLGKLSNDICVLLSNSLGVFDNTLVCVRSRNGSLLVYMLSLWHINIFLQIYENRSEKTIVFRTNCSSGGTRTHTPLRGTDFESVAYTNSATEPSWYSPLDLNQDTALLGSPSYKDVAFTVKLGEHIGARQQPRFQTIRSPYVWNRTKTYAQRRAHMLPDTSHRYNGGPCRT